MSEAANQIILALTLPLSTGFMVCGVLALLQVRRERKALARQVAHIARSPGRRLYRLGQRH